MKNKLLLSIILFSIKTFGQITTTSITKAEREIINPNPPKYDSLLNFLGNNVYQYLGQELYLRPKNNDLRKYGYENFYNQTDDGLKRNGENIYKCCQNYSSIYEDLAGKYYEVIEIVKHPKADEDKLLYGSKYFIKLKEKETKSICYYKYDCKGIEETFPFTVVGYFEKCKKKYVGKKYQTKGINWQTKGLTTIADIVTGKEISIEKGKIWKCIDVTIEDKYFTLSLVIQSTTGEKLTIPINSLQADYFVSEKLK